MVSVCCGDDGGGAIIWLAWLSYGTMVQKEHYVQCAAKYASCFLMVVGAKRMSGAKSRRYIARWWKNGIELIELTTLLDDASLEFFPVSRYIPFAPVLFTVPWVGLSRAIRRGQEQ